jgi:hypothetical protein
MGFLSANGALQRTADAPHASVPPRICMPTWRNFSKKAYRGGLYEAQDVLVEIDDVDLISLDMAWAAKINERWLRLPLYHDIFKKMIFANPGLKNVKLQRDYDIFLVVCNTYWDLPYINAIEHWKDHCKISVCWIDEMWARDIPGYKHWLHALSRFDYVFMGCRGSVSALSNAANRSCFWLPGGVDMLRFSAVHDSLTRAIDVYSIGRRYDGIHRELLRAAERRELFYVHDTIINFANTDVYNHQHHRNLLANMANRSRYFVVAPAKMDAAYETQGQVEIGYRYFEGAAAGAVMIGEVPDCEAYRELFGWPQAVIQIQPDGSNVMAVLSELGSDPERMAAISKRNTNEALLRHDWVYRWKEMFRIAGIEPSPRMATRERRLKNMVQR